MMKGAPWLSSPGNAESVSIKLFCRFKLNDDTWSYTNFSSSQASETRYGDSFCLSDGEEIDIKVKEAEGNDTNKEDNHEVLEFAAKHETPKVNKEIES